MKGLGSQDTSVKYGTPFAVMECDHCEKPNLFECHRIHGRLTARCLEIAQIRFEAHRRR